ncbi:MAG TPA: glycosyltransferase family 39 protein [Vicinamibacterales bacterium]|nr:glycosyltransferase family 39 protein [Vicinamibacterales bacterium]
MSAPRPAIARVFEILDPRRLHPFIQWSIITWIVVFWRLGYPSLLDPDEAHYAELTREMIRARSWFVPLLDGAPYIDKPVLFHWLQGASIQLLGESEFAIRFPIALAALALFWTIRWLGNEVFDGRSGDAGAMMFATIPATFMLASVGLFDMIFAAFLFGSVACLLVAAIRKREGFEYLGWLLLTLAAMTKGPVALVLAGGFFVAVTVVGGEGREVIARLKWPAGLLFAFFAASPWFLWMWGRFGDEFIQRYVLAGNVWYVTNPVAFSTRASSYAFYARTFAGAFFPWSAIAIGHGLDGLAQRSNRGCVPPIEKLLWIWIAVVIATFTIAGFKLDTYIFPAAPACCLLAAVGWRRAGTDPTRAWTRWAAAIMAGVLVAGGIVASVAMFRVNLGLAWSAILLPTVMVAGGTWMLREISDRGWATTPRLASPIVTLLAVYSAIVMFGLPVLERSRPTAPIGRWIQRHSTPDTAVAIYGLSDWRASIRYYADHSIVELPDEVAVSRFVDEHPGGLVLMLRRDYDALRAGGIEIKRVQDRPIIAGRSGRFIRRQIWDDLVVAAPKNALVADGEP